MKKSGSVRVVKNFQVGRKKPRVDFRAKRVRVALQVPRRVVSVKVSKMKVVGEEVRD